MTATDDSIAKEPKDSGENLTEDALTQRLMQGMMGETPPEEPEEEPEAEEETEVEVESEEESEEEVDTEEEADADEDLEDDDAEDEPTDIDLLSLTPEQIQELAKKGKSRLLARIGELTARTKAAEAQLEELKASKPSREIPQDQNPFKELKSFDDIKAKYAELEQTLEATDQLLEEHEDYGPDDIIEVGDQEFTKKQLRQANRNAREAITKYLPAQAEHLKKQESYVEANKQWVDQAKKEVPEIQDEESDIGKAYKQLVESPNIKKLKEVAPELGVDVEYILAHAVRSKFGMIKPKVSKGAGKKLKVQPPASPVGAGAASGAKPSGSKVQDLKKRFDQSGSESDLIAYLTAQAANR